MPNEAYNLNKTEKVWVQKSHAPGKGDRERPSLAEYLSCVVFVYKIDQIFYNERLM